MDSVVQDADSSSARDSTFYKVTFAREASGGIYRISCEGASSFLTREVYLSRAVADVLGDLSDSRVKKVSLGKEDFVSLVSSGEAFADERYLLDCLSRREYSRQDLRLRLLKKQRPEHQINLVLDYIQSRGWLDEERFARVWLESRIKKMPEGASALRKGLLSHGISSSLADSVIKNFFTEVSEEELFKRCAEKYKKSHRNLNQNKLILHLQRRGFSFYLINKLERIGDNG